jgi:hypothetical protein
LRLKDIDKLVRESKARKVVLVLNFSPKELEYIGQKWVVKNLP